MKNLIIFALLLCSQIVYSQDLIITTTGDSLRCKILDVNTDEIQIRFGRTGNVITILKDETVSVEYNYILTSPESGAASKKPFFVSVGSGASTFGSLSTGDAERGGATVICADAAYFFGAHFGAGLKLNVSSCRVNFSDMFLCNDRVVFCGPALFSSFGKKRLAFAANAGVGVLNWNLSDVRIDDVSIDNKSATSVGAMLSAGVNYKLTPHIGLGARLQSVIGSMRADNYERNTSSVGFVLGLNFRF